MSQGLLADRLRDDPDEPRLSAWERRTDWPLTGLAIAFLFAYGWQVLDTAKSQGVHQFLELVMWAVWALFSVDYLIRFYLSRRKGRFLWTHLFDLLIVLLPWVRQLRVLRLVTVVRVLNRRVATSVRGQVGVYVAGVTLLVGLCASLAVLDAERHNPDASITSFGEAMWWTITTISTVGYGDRYPTTAEGRMVAAGLMIGGIALLGVVTGVIASWFVEKIQGVEQSIEHITREEVRALRGDLAALRDQLATDRGPQTTNHVGLSGGGRVLGDGPADHVVRPGDQLGEQK
ncbi:voltage-gated potassium channel [Herbihabitans rhizosphaerae]|uniref:Voltage-gated potassium channel n=1 Tax=Herbihabitans rhizosphaerae TaxID=1872711 RepID=A0A4V2ETK6_9PSEU|nr:potassium channel family protein [Herbihabitans rhizosphaerae]RZS41403.1 voltage-gated potassium channel [Herbihabitans rhizosphaerae]